MLRFGIQIDSKPMAVTSGSINERLDYLRNGCSTLGAKALSDRKQWTRSKNGAFANQRVPMSNSDLDAFHATLSSEDFFALNAIKANDYSFLPKPQIERLIAFGLVREGLAGLRLTEPGEIRAAVQK
jgi:hypothetical protein